MKEFKGCNGCIFLRKYADGEEYFCASNSRTDDIETIADCKIGSNSIWPFKIVNPKDIISCNGYMKNEKK